MIPSAHALIDQTNSLLKNCSVSAGYCCCGAAPSPGGRGYCDNHSYTDQGEYTAAGLQRDLQTWLGAQGWQVPDPDALVAAPRGSCYWVMLTNGTGPTLMRVVGQANGREGVRLTDNATETLWPLRYVARMQSLYIPEPPK